MHVRALMKVESMKMYITEGIERSLRRDAGFANKANPPQRAAPCPPPPSPLEQREKGGGRGKEGRGAGEREGRERGSENERQ